jgi:uncharacterized membrane protein
MITDPLGIATVIAVVTAIGLWMDRTFTWAARVSSALLVLALGAVLSNMGLVPAQSPVYDGVFGPVTSLAICWLLFGVHFSDLKGAGPRMLGAFGLAVLGTSTGALVGGLVYAGAFDGDVWRLAGVLTGTYSGGSLNFVAVGRAVDLPTSLFSAAAAADAMVTGVWMGATLLLPLWLGKRYRPIPGGPAPADNAVTGREPVDAPAPSAGNRPAASDSPTPPSSPLAGAELRITDLAILIALGFAILNASAALHGLVPAVPEILWLTTLSLGMAQLSSVRSLHGALPLGYLALHLFFVVIGIGSRVDEIMRVGPEVLYITALVVVVHGIIVYGGGWLARLDSGTISVASQAAVGGPSSALALAIARDWPRLALPGVAVGLLGYAVGTYAGLGVAWLVRALTG